MAANVNVNLVAALLQIFNLTTSAFETNVPLGNVVLPATASFYDSFLQVAISPGSVIALPAATVWFAVVVNRNAPAGSNITVQQTVTGGAQVTAANSLVLAPGGAWVFANPTELAGGLTGLTLISSAGTSTVAVLLGS